MIDPDDTAAAFRLRTAYHFRRSGAFLLTVLTLGLVTWLQDVAASRAGGGSPLVLAVALAFALGLVMVTFGVTVTRDVRSYRMARWGGRPGLVLSVHPEGAIFYLLNVTLSWREAGEVQIVTAPPGGKLLPGPLARRLRPVHSVVFGPGQPVPGRRIPAFMRARARRALSRYGTPFVVDLSAIAADPAAVEGALRTFSPRPVRRLALARAAGPPQRAAGPGEPGRPAQAAGGRSVFQWATALAAPVLTVAVAFWAVAMPLHDAWLMQHGRLADARIMAVTSPCGYQAPGSYLITFPGPGGMHVVENTSHISGCPQPYTVLEVKYDPANPRDVGDIQVLRARPLPLLMLSLAGVIGGSLVHFAFQAWRYPPRLRRRPARGYVLR